LLSTLSKRHYEGLWAVGLTIYDRERPEVWALGKRVLNAYQLPANPEGWAKLVRRLTKTPVIAADESRRRNAEKRWANQRQSQGDQLDAPIECREASEWRKAVLETQWLTLIPKVREVKRWNPLTHCYEVIGEELVYVVR
jgi:hypothetical protein